MSEAPETDHVDPVTFFSPEIHNAVSGMIFLGKHTKEVNFVGHRFVLETIRPFLKYAIGQAMEPFRDTLVQPQAWAAMHVGVALSSIDGKVDFSPPIGSNEVEFVRQRFDYITGQTGWYQSVIDYLFAEYNALEMETTQAIAELHSLAQAGKVTSSPWPGFLTEMEPSADATNEDGPASEGSSSTS